MYYLLLFVIFWYHGCWLELHNAISVGLVIIIQNQKWVK